MRIVCISDTHGQHENMRFPIPKGNILIHAGDCTNVGTQDNVREFVEWFQNINGFDSKIFCSGNHDWAFERKPAWLRNYINDENLSQSDVVYLEDSEFIIEDPEFSRPIKFWGSPWQPEFCNWAFNVPRENLHKYWELIPGDTDVLITHSPSYGSLDKVEFRNPSLGCESLRDHILKIKPKIHICGHIHGGRGVVEKDGVLYINASIATERYEMINKPIVIDFSEIKGKLISQLIDC